MAQQIHPTVFTTDRLLEFTSVNKLSKLVGAVPDLWPVIAIKELVDNALDACEDASIAPEIAVEISTDHHTITVRDNGPGITPDVVERLADLRTKTSSREAYVTPTRGAQGNALQTILAMPFALDGTSGRTVIESRGIAHTIDFTIDHIHRVPQVSITKAPSFVQNGVSFTLRWTDSPRRRKGSNCTNRPRLRLPQSSRRVPPDLERCVLGRGYRGQSVMAQIAPGLSRPHPLV
jgi:hypothetical protein